MKRIRPAWAIAAAACALLVAVGVVGTTATGLGWNWSRLSLRGQTVIARGGIRYAATRPVPLISGDIPILGHLFRVPRPPAWLPRVSFANGNREIVLPFWTIGAVGLLGLALAWRRVRRPLPGCCARCGYDLAGLNSGVCPECGASHGACA